MADPRFDSLFARLMLAQTILTLLVGGLFVAWLVSSRSHVTAEPYAQLWAGNMAEAVRGPPGADLPAASAGYPLRRQAGRPEGLVSYNLTILPGFGSWRSEFALRGLAIDDMRVVLNGGNAQLWFHTVQAGLAPVWLWLPAPRIFPFINTLNAPVALLIVAMVVGLSWWFARHVTLPLQQLSRRMRGDVLAIDTKGGLVAFTAPVLHGASAEIRRIDSDYQQLLERLRIAELERALLLAGVSHDLRSPLSRIRLAAELLPQRSDPQPHIEAITRNIDHADELIGSFLDFVRAGSLAMDETVDVAALARAVVARLDGPSELLCMALTPVSVPLVRTNGLLMERLIFNLIDNGLKHGKAPVAVTVSARHRPAGRHTVQIDVCDAGDGLPVGRQAELLQAFARGDPGRSRPGSGLGLSIVRQVVARMGGTLAFVRDETGHHAIVCFARAPAPSPTT